MYVFVDRKIDKVIFILVDVKVVLELICEVMWFFFYFKKNFNKKVYSSIVLISDWYSERNNKRDEVNMMKKVVFLDVEIMDLFSFDMIVLDSFNVDVILY